MGDGARLAIAILILFVAMVAFFFAFHPHGVANPDGSAVNNPGDILKWMFGVFNGTVTGSTATAPASGTAQPTGSSVAPIANTPGTNVGPTVP
jgi:hypothetical protein